MLVLSIKMKLVKRHRADREHHSVCWGRKPVEQAFTLSLGHRNIQASQRDRARKLWGPSLAFSYSKKKLEILRFIVRVIKRFVRMYETGQEVTSPSQTLH